jgi:hypothetical protein
VGSQTTATTSLGISTLGTIIFPAAATSETASAVTPVAAGGTVTTTSPTAITSTTTAGSFLTLKHTYASTVVLDTDLQMLVYTMPFLQSAAAAMALNTLGLQFWTARRPGAAWIPEETRFRAIKWSHSSRQAIYQVDTTFCPFWSYGA